MPARTYRFRVQGTGHKDSAIIVGQEVDLMALSQIPFKAWHVRGARGFPNSSVGGWHGAQAAWMKRRKMRIDRILTGKRVVSYFPKTQAELEAREGVRKAKARMDMAAWRAAQPDANGDYYRRPPKTDAEKLAHKREYMRMYQRQKRAGVAEPDMQGVKYPRKPKIGEAGYVNYAGEEMLIGPRINPADAPWLFGRR